MTLRSLLVVAIVSGTALAQAAPRKVFVLPVDGTADPALRKALDVQVDKLAHQLPGTVTTGDATFADTAAMVGCDPAQPACTDTVLATLSADELVWGTATTANGQTTFVVKRAIKGNVREQVAIVGEPEAVAGELQPLFGGTVAGPAVEAGAGSGSGSDPGTGTGPGPSTGPISGDATAGWSGDKKLGLGFVAGGVVAVAIGIALWANEDSLQGQIDATPLPQTSKDVQSLVATEDRAQSYANWGNGMVLLGVVAGGVGAYYLWKDHREHVTAVAPAPAPSGTGATLVIGGRW